MSVTVPKNERERWASKRITDLESILRELAVRACEPLDDICKVELRQVLSDNRDEEQQNKNMYEVIFTDGFALIEWAPSAEQAKILAQSRRIRGDKIYGVKECNYIGPGCGW